MKDVQLLAKWQHCTRIAASLAQKMHQAECRFSNRSRSSIHLHKKSVLKWHDAASLRVFAYDCAALSIAQLRRAVASVNKTLTPSICTPSKNWNKFDTSPHAASHLCFM